MGFHTPKFRMGLLKLAFAVLGFGGIRRLHTAKQKGVSWWFNQRIDWFLRFSVVVGWFRGSFPADLSVRTALRSCMGGISASIPRKPIPGANLIFKDMHPNTACLVAGSAGNLTFLGRHPIFGKEEVFRGWLLLTQVMMWVCLTPTPNTRPFFRV